MMNAIEDPRDNNFVADAYPKFKEQMNLAYTLEQEFDAEAKEIAKKKMGTKPRFLQAGHEYIKQWFNEVQGKPFAIDEKLPREVREVVKKTLDAAQDSWWRYPSKAEADESEALISKYAENAYDINLNKVWPEFKKLVDEDMKDQETRKALEDMQKDASGESSGEGKPQEGSPKNIPENLKSNLTPEQQKELGKALEDPQGKPGTPQPIDMDDLSPELKKKLREYIDSLPEEKKRELAEAAAKIIKEVEDEINKALEGKLVDQAERSQERGAPQPEFTGERETRPEDVEDVRAKLREMLESDKGVYDQVRREVLPVINRLEDDLRELFVERRARKWETGHKFGKKIDLKKRMQEKVKGVSAVDTRAWQKREAPQEKDYAITLLVDLSGSMGRGGKVEETFKAVVVLCEVLNALSIKTEILGFNDRIHEYQDFHTTLKDETRQAMGRMLSEVKSSRAEYNDDGWALKQASTRLARQEAGEKFLIALSDGLPEESSAHSGKEFELGKVVKEIMDQTDQKLIGLGIGRGTKHVEKYYPNNLADVPVAEMAQKLADLLREAIANYQDF